MFALLLPVKEFSRSKHRLAEWLSPMERALLARRMFDEVWKTLRNCVRNGIADTLLVISKEPAVLARCREENVRYLIEEEPRSHSESVSVATAWAETLGVTSLLSLPIDAPAVTENEIAVIADLAESYSVVVVPSADGTGTNALLRTPPGAIAPRFGPGSCRLHAAQAAGNGLPYLIHPVAGLAADIDTPEDVERFLAFVASTGRESRTANLLRRFAASRPGVGVCF
jgi:2-phospho-L-lactate guanylyltransferase